LSTARSIALLQTLAGRYGIPNDRLSAAGYAETKPIDTNDSAEGRTHNRRVDIIILNQPVILNSGKVPPVAQKAGR
jgi:chemotaxis protein MotB